MAAWVNPRDRRQPLPEPTTFEQDPNAPPTVAEPGRILIGTTDGRLLDCPTVRRVPVLSEHAESTRRSVRAYRRVGASRPLVISQGPGHPLNYAPGETSHHSAAFTSQW